MSGKTVQRSRKISSKLVHIEQVIGLAKTFKILTVALNRTETKLARDISSIEAPSSYHLWWCCVVVPEVIVCAGATGSCITGYDVTGSCITGNEREIISHVFPGTPLDSRYEQWNCESNLYRVTIDLLLPMLNHFSLLNCAVSRD